MDGVGLRKFRVWHCGVVAALIAGPMLAGCSSIPSAPSTSSLPSISSLFGSKTDGADANASATKPPDFECPDVTVRQGAATLTSSANPAEPTALNLRYQVSIGTTARECKLNAGIVSMKVGMQGRVILGPEGTAGSIDVPLRFAVVKEGVDPKVIVTKLDRIAVTVPPNDSNVLFNHVTEGLDFPMPKGGEIDSYVVYIGFDPQGLEEPKKKPAPKPAKPRRRQVG
jgi:hypothetical protein